MMDPKIGWFQLEHKGPALDLWVKTWKDAIGTDGKSSMTEEKKDCPKIGIQKVGLYLTQTLRDNPSSTYDLDNNLHLIAKYNGTPWLLSKDPIYEGIDGLHKEIEDFFEYIKPKPTERQIRVEVQQRITKCIENLWTDAVVRDTCL